MELNKYLGLLKWSLNYTDGTQPTELSEMDEERRKWLKEAMEAGTVDPADQMKALISVLQVERPNKQDAVEKKYEAEFVDNKVTSLEHLQEWVESIDWATDLHKLGGFETVIKLCSDPEQRIRVRALEVFATVVQNNPQCQDWALELGGLKPLVESLEKAADELEQSKILLALASLVRNHSKATIEFIKEFKGVALLLQLAQGKTKGGAVAHPKCRAKAVFLLRYLTDTVPAIRVTAAPQLVQALNPCAVHDNADLRGHALGLLAIIYGDSNSIARVTSDDRQATEATLAKLVPENAASFSPALDEHSLTLAAELRKVMQTPPHPDAGPANPDLMLAN